MHRSSPAISGRGQAYAIPVKHGGHGAFRGNGKKTAVAVAQDLGFEK